MPSPTPVSTAYPSRTPRYPNRHPQAMKNVLARKFPFIFPAEAEGKLLASKNRDPSNKQLLLGPHPKSRQLGQKIQKLEVPNRESGYPAMLLMRHSPHSERPQSYQDTQRSITPKRLQIPRIVELDQETDPLNQMDLRCH